MLCSLLLFALLASAQGRAVNISNTWVLPEEGFPVFYRYFRDRISWYEADAVCQFHHANLVTVDTTAQYDAVRAYLKELDISSAVWVGLIRSNPDGDFTWTDYRGLSGDGYWSSAPDARSAPLCAAADPAADYRWEARACGGPTVASFICELPVPQWALGNEGCMVRALPALTVLYLPESAAVQLTADCGMAGVKRLQCTGNVKHEELLRDLSCTEDEESPQPTSMTSTVMTGVTTDGDLETSEATNEEIATTEHEDDPLNIITSTPDLFKHISSTQNQVMTNRPVQSQNNKILSIKNINLDIALHNNLQSNDIPRLEMHDNFYSNEQLQKQEDEKNMQHKLLHDELARLGNIENIFSQPTDHFVPPLVMAKAKVNEDINAISFEEKLAQQHSEYLVSKHIYEVNATQNVETDKDQKSTSTGKSILSTTEVPQISTLNKLKVKKEMSKHVLPKKYDHKSIDIKTKLQPIKFMKNVKSTTISQTEGTSPVTETTTFRNTVYFDPTNEDSLLDLTVIIKESETNNSSATNNSNNSLDVSYINKTNNEHFSMEADSNIQTVPEAYELSSESNDFHNITLNDEIIKITFIHDEMHSPHNLTVLEVTTKMPIFKDSTENDLRITSFTHTSTSTEKADDVSTSASTLIKDEVTMTSNNHMNDNPNITNTEYNYETTKLNIISTETMSKTSSETSHIEITTERHTTESKHIVDDTNNTTLTTPQLAVKEITDELPELEHLDDVDRNITDTSQYIDDFQSPLLSGANEPLHKPNRSRRPQQPANRIKKFNPFRILG